MLIEIRGKRHGLERMDFHAQAGGNGDHLTQSGRIKPPGTEVRRDIVAAEHPDSRRSFIFSKRCSATARSNAAMTEDIWRIIAECPVRSMSNSIFPNAMSTSFRLLASTK